MISGNGSYYSNPDKSKIYGVIIAIVSDNNDPEKLGRVRISFPSLSGERVEYWAQYAVLMAGKETGTYFLPEIGEQVIVSFENGEISRPFILGSLWNSADKPPEVESGDENNIRMIKSRSGHIIRLDDTDSKEKIEIIDKSGKNLIIFDTAENTLTIKAEKNIKIEAAEGIDLSSKALKISADDSIDIAAKDIKISAENEVGLEAKKGMSLDGGAKTKIAGKRVDIN